MNERHVSESDKGKCEKSNLVLMESGMLQGSGPFFQAALWRALQACGVHYDALYYCPHAPDCEPPCMCRKPQPGLLLQAAEDFNLDLSRSYIIGDKQSDLAAGYAAGCHTVLVRTGFGEEAYKALTQQLRQPDYVAATLLEAVQWVTRDISIVR